MAPLDNSDQAFEAGLRDDFPRGFERVAKAAGRDRGLSASWLQPDEMAGPRWTAARGILLGTRAGATRHWNDDRHLLTIAGTRAGKGVSAIIPNLLTWEGAAVVVDPKGANATVTAGRRGKGSRGGGPGLGQDVHVLDPFGESGLVSSAYNVLCGLDARSPDVVEDIGGFAEALIMHPERGERYWTESAQALLRALILLVVADIRFEDRRNLVTVRRLLTLTDPAIAKLKDAQPEDVELSSENALIRLLLDQEHTPYGYICIGMGEQLMAMSDKERGGVMSSARTQTVWLDGPRVPSVLSRSDFDLADLKRKRMTLYLCLPATRMGTYARWLRLMILLSLSAMEREKTVTDQPVLFVLDEFPVLGFMEAVETAAGLMAGFGVKLWPIIQNIGQLKKHYPSSWETFFANAGVITAFGVTDGETLKVLSESLGRTGIVSKVDSGASRSALNQGTSPLHDDRREVPLLAEHELRMAFARDKQRMLILNAETSPAVVRRLRYYDHPLFEGLYDVDPSVRLTP